MSAHGIFISMVIAWVAAVAPKAAAVRAFPTAEGFGANALGGRGGRVIEVTNLNDSGPGSLRDCAENSGPRTCVFRVAGTIELQRHISITGEKSSYLTIAGQTAPGEGVQLKNWFLEVSYGAHDVIIRHIRVRSGTGHHPMDINNDCGGIIIYVDVHDVIIDHSDFEWACDDTVNIFGANKNLTVQWSLIAEGLNESDYVNEDGGYATSKGLIFGSTGPYGSSLSFHHNLLADIESRVPAAGGNHYPVEDSVIDFRNNVVFNWYACTPSNFGLHAKDQPGWDGPFDIKANFVGNKYLPGPLSNTTQCDLGGIGSSGGLTQVYVEDNWTPYCGDHCTSQWNQGWIESSTDGGLSLPASEANYANYSPLNVPLVATTPQFEVEEVVLANVGVTRPVRDSLDARIIDGVRTRTGRLNRGPIDLRYPVLSGGMVPPDRDHDGMPDDFEIANGLNPDEPADGARTAVNGYTNLENYLNELAGDFGAKPPPTPSPDLTPPTVRIVSPVDGEMIAL